MILWVPSFFLCFVVSNSTKNKAVGLFNKIANWLNDKVEKNKGQIEKLGYWGLLLFVGVPLPGTGAWTGTLLAAMLNLDKKKSFLVISRSIVLSAVIFVARTDVFLSINKSKQAFAFIRTRPVTSSG